MGELLNWLVVSLAPSLIESVPSFGELGGESAVVETTNGCGF
jgi:hypothetical protein